jgi:signal transduction histidine kinase
MVYGDMNIYKFTLLPIVAFAAATATVATTVARMRDGRLKETIRWLSFCKAYPIRTPAGAAMTVLLAIDLCVLLAFMATGYRADVNLLIFAFALVSLAVLTYFCRFICALAASYEKANEDKIKSERFKAELIANVSHDIRTPLTSVVNYVDLIKRLPLPIDDAVLAEYIAVLDKKSQRLKTLIGDLLEASKAGTGNIPVDLQRIELTEIVGQIAGEFDDAFAAGRLTLVLAQAREKVFVTADGKLLWRVMENIFGNAAKYAMPDTRVYADIVQNNKTIVFSLKNVSREALNISPAELTERFVRGDRARSDEGNGLGLYIAQNLTELMGGRFTLRISGDLFEVLLSFPHSP